MVASLRMQLQSEENLSFQMTSLFHGALMELLPGDYAEELHFAMRHPYSQHLESVNQTWYWVVNCLNEEATARIIRGALEDLSQIRLKKRDLTVTIIKKIYTEQSDRSLMEEFYGGKQDRYISIQFITPTAFKRQGQYCIYPDLRCIYQSLMRRYDESSSREGMFDEETLEQICQDSEIVRYDLKSTCFHLEGVRIPSFIGKITIHLKGTQTMANFVWLLFQYGQYSGVGIKTSLGMGSLRILAGGERRKKE